LTEKFSGSRPKLVALSAPMPVQKFPEWALSTFRADPAFHFTVSVNRYKSDERSGANTAVKRRCCGGGGTFDIGSDA
jgi:hypothetical protein